MNGRPKRDNHRIIFPDFDWFDVSSEIFVRGFVPSMTGAAFKRYVTLRYLANKNCNNVIQVSLLALEKLGGICPRRAHEVNAHLQEMRMVDVERDANPYRYRLYLPTEWRKGVPPGSNSQGNTAPRLVEGVPWQ
jgi:hypothetical protein